MGVDYDRFWEMNPKELEPFVKAFELKTKYNDVMAWQQGIYIRAAIASSMDKKNKYPEKPIFSDLSPLTPKQKKAEQLEQEIMDKMFATMKRINSKFSQE